MIFFHTAALLWTLSLAAGHNTDSIENVALIGRATQSTNAGGLSYALNAIDGNLNSNFHHGSCFSTQYENSPWWRVDLLMPYTISHITITNRGDCCDSFLNGAEILIGDSLDNNGNNNPRFAQISSIPLGGTQTFKPNTRMTGRYVNIILRGKWQYLTFCEVQIFREGGCCT